ncbi:MAG: hypothetical protein JXC33_09865 [Deltaproteobacteria bacterium]|nr:hypothetical protein [Deltaproteobacteria bacterium]
MKKGLFIIFIVLCSLVIAAASLSKNLVISEGKSFIHDERVDSARDKASDSALRSAVEQTVGVMISSTTEVVSFEIKLDQIVSESKGFINSYKILT